ncbi:MAG: hypothetical protein PHR98_02545 [Candidatus Shapirobacteria bacterium]|nr:hypothetical protein [Candidatus Shapirobacteria bacterium]
MKYKYYTILFLLYLPFLLIQYFTTKPTKLLEHTEIETVEQIYRMHQYPPYAYRLANIIEARSEFRIFFKLEKNFISSFDISNFFNSYRIFLLPIFLIGYFEIIKKYPKETLFFSFLPIVLLTIIGHQNLYGPISLYPIMLLSIIIGLLKLANKWI